MKVFVTKYWATKGIFEAEVQETHDASMVVWGEMYQGRVYLHRDEWFRTLPAARYQARCLRDKKIASLEKQIAKLKAMTF